MVAGGIRNQRNIGIKVSLTCLESTQVLCGQDSRVLSKAAIPVWIRQNALAVGSGVGEGGGGVVGDGQGDRVSSCLFQRIIASPLPSPMMWPLPHSPSPLPEGPAKIGDENTQKAEAGR